MTKGQEIAEKIRRGAFIASSCGDDIVELDSSAAEDIDAAIAEARREQALADCRAVCKTCRQLPSLKTSAGEYYHRVGDNYCYDCQAHEIRVRWKVATGKELT